MAGQLFWPVVTLVATFFLRDRGFGASGFTLGALTLPSVLGMFVAFGMLLMVQYLSAEREDGTLLRAKAIPNGIRGYFIGKLVTVSGAILAYLAILLVPGMLIVDGLDGGSVRSWFTLAWVPLLGLVATQSIGALLGSLVSSSRGVGYISLPVVGWSRSPPSSTRSPPSRNGCRGSLRRSDVLARPGMRSALLPHTAAGVEIGESWRHLQTAGVLGAWAVLGVIVAPIVLRRMARRESGSSVSERRQKLLQRIS